MPVWGTVFESELAEQDQPYPRYTTFLRVRDLADYLKSADLDGLPSDEEFFAALERHALAAALATQSDAEMVRNLREDFGAAGLAALVAQLPPRRGALLFALTPAEAQHELVRLLLLAFYFFPER